MRLNEVEPTAKGRKAGEKSRKDDAWREQGPRFQRWSLSDQVPDVTLILTWTRHSQGITLSCVFSLKKQL